MDQIRTNKQSNLFLEKRVPIFATKKVCGLKNIQISFSRCLRGYKKCRHCSVRTWNLERKTIDTILHMRIIYAEIQNLLKEIFHLLKEKNVFQRLLATILIFSAAFTQTEISSYSDVDKQSRCLCSTNRLLQI